MPFPPLIAQVVKGIAEAILGVIDIVLIGDVAVSALTDLSNPSELRVTRKPIHQGYAITDAAVDEPLEIQMGVCLADPQYTPDELARALLNGTIASFTESWRDKRDALYQMQYDRELVTVITHDQVYFNMLLQSIDPIYNTEFNGDCLFARLTLIQINVVDLVEATGILDQAKQAVGGI